MRQLYINLKPALKALELTTNSVMGTTLMGNYTSLLPGAGLEFKGYTEYTPATDSKLIDWKASLKSNTLLIREHTEERNVSAFFLISTSGSMIYTSTKKLKAEYAGELVASLAYIMMKENDLFGFAMFNNKIKTLALPECSMTQFYKLSQSLIRTEYYGGNSNLTEALQFAFRTLKPKTMLFIISDFIGLSRGWEDALKQASSKLDIIAIIVRDPADLALPTLHTSEVLVRSPSSNQIVNVRIASVRDKYRDYVDRQMLHIRKVFAECNSDVLLLTTDKSFVAPILNFFTVRKHKRWR